MNKRMWISWEVQRRTVELSKKFNCKLHIIVSEKKFRHLICSFKTIRILLHEKPQLLFVQNPSMVLAFIACLYRLISNNIVIVDRHTTFRINKKPEISLDYMLFKFLHWFTIKYANLTIVTNKYLAELVIKTGGKPYILPDKFPDLLPTKKTYLKEGFNILLVSSFGYDEPIDIVLQAMTTLEHEEINLYVTGNFKKLKKGIVNAKNVIFTGFLPEIEFINMLFSVDSVMVLTTADHTMLCGCYEAISAGKPLITSDKLVLVEYFNRAVFVDNTCDDIVNAIRQVVENYDENVKNTMLMKIELEDKWLKSYQQMEMMLEGITKK